MSEHKRVKHGSLPGDVSRRTKIAMREKRKITWVGYPIPEACAKSFRKYVQDKSRKVQRRRDRREIERGLEP